MRRITSVLAVVVTTVAVLWLAVPASAATVTSTSGMPAGLTFSPGACSGGPPPAGSFTHVTGPATPTLNTGSLEILQPRDTASSLNYNFNGADTVSQLTTLSLGTYRPPGGAVGAVRLIMGLNAGDYDQLQAPLPAFGAWTQSDLLSIAYHVYHVTNSGSTFTDQGYETWSTYVTGHPTAPLGALSINVDTCNESSGGDFFVDAIAITDNGASTTYDFEPGPTPTLTAGAPAKSVSGGATKVAATLKNQGVAISGDKVTLWAKPSGASGFSAVGTATTNVSGIAKSTQHPTVTTAYKWTFDGDGSNSPATSTAKVVKVAVHLTLHVADSSLAHGQPLVGWGAASPAKTGAVVTLWRQLHNHVTKLATTHLQSDGTWSISKTLSKGGYVLFATVPATTTDTAGKSTAVKLTAS